MELGEILDRSTRAPLHEIRRQHGASQRNIARPPGSEALRIIRRKSKFSVSTFAMERFQILIYKNNSGTYFYLEIIQVNDF